MRLLIASLAALTAGMPMAASADTLADAMSTAVQTNPSLGAARQRLRATREVLPQAWSEALPQINLSAGATRAARVVPKSAVRSPTMTARCNHFCWTSPTPMPRSSRPRLS